MGMVNSSSYFEGCLPLSILGGDILALKEIPEHLDNIGSGL